MDAGGVCSGRSEDCNGFAYRAFLKKEYEGSETAMTIVDGMKRRPKEGFQGESLGGRMVSKWVMDVSGAVEPLELATTTKERLRGLLFRTPDDVTRILIPCHDIHTFGMRHPLDVAFISREGQVLEVHRNVSAMRRIRRRDASIVAERFFRDGEWLKEGDVIRIGAVD